MNTQNTSFWSSNLGFMLACIGAAVGLGNIWKFPYMTGTQGGGAFVFIYLITIFAIAIPVAAAELLIGRKGQSDAGTSVVNVATENQRSARWGAIGGLGVLASFILLTFYAVIAGWVSAYIWRSVSGQIGGLDAAGAGSMFGALLANPGEMIFHQILFLAMKQTEYYHVTREIFEADSISGMTHEHLADLEPPSHFVSSNTITSKLECHQQQLLVHELPRKMA